MSWFRTNAQLRKKIRALISLGDAAVEKVVNQKYVLLEKASELAAHGYTFSANSLRSAYDELLHTWHAGATPYHRNNIDRMRRCELRETINRLAYRVRMLENAPMPISLIERHHPNKETELRMLLQQRVERVEVLYAQMKKLYERCTPQSEMGEEQGLALGSTFETIKLMKTCLGSESAGVGYLVATEESTRSAVASISGAIARLAAMKIK